MPTRQALERIKSATVALALLPEAPPADRTQTPFTIIGSGFCIDPGGVVITCEHVISAFSHDDIRQAIAAVPSEDRSGAVWPLHNLRVLVPYVLFFRFDPSSENLIVFPVRVSHAAAKLEFDLGAAVLSSHPAFSKGFPFLDIEPYSSIYEGMDVATCGFPLGNEMQRQLGSMTSSFTRGILSSIAPAPGTKEELVKGFQLDLTATNGNSGGPVFSWETGKVFGVLQGGPLRAPGEVLPGIARAEPIYRLLRDGLITRLKGETPT